MRTPDECIRAGLAYLASVQAPNGGFEVVVAVGGPGFPTGAVTSPFVTGLVLDAIHMLGKEFDIRRLVDRAIAYLLREMESSGLWRFYHCTPPLRRDLDSTSVALFALRRYGVPLDYPNIVGRLLPYRDGMGRFQTWALDSQPLLQRLFRDPRSLLRRPFNVVDPVVNANVISLVRAVDRDVPEAEVFVMAHAESDAALEGNHYYLHPQCFVHALSKHIAMNPSDDRACESAKSLVERLLARQKAVHGEHPFLLMRLMTASLRMRLTWPRSEDAAEAAIATQLPDGSWPWGPVWTAVRWARGAPRPLLGSPAVETAVALELLGRTFHDAPESTGVRVTGLVRP